MLYPYMIKFNLLGMNIGYLTVVSDAGWKYYKKNKVSQWMCICICGKNVLVTSTLLLRKKNPKKSCGCKNFTGIHGNRKLRNPQISSFLALIKRYRNSAKHKTKNIKWLLTNEEAINLFKDNCYYCGICPQNTYNVYITKKGKSNTKNIDYAKTAEIVFNGIDRKNSSLHYSTDNSVTCCTTCNFAKSELTLDIFYEWLDRIAIYRGFIK